MPTFFEVLPDTKEYESAWKVFHWVDDWYKDDVTKDLEDALGVKVNQNLVCWPHVLQLKEIPEGTREQFKKNRVDVKGGYAYEAKVRSNLNKKFLAIVEKHGLYYYDMVNFSVLTAKTIGSGMSLHHMYDATRFFIEAERCLDTLRSNSSLKEIPEYEFYELKAEWKKGDVDE